ncbi:hypothetical protein BDE02_04G131100 [Populus trichocarpa]|nr:hypothetical protein BDE02_04G131100 [Populus trichocarpa]
MLILKTCKWGCACSFLFRSSNPLKTSFVKIFSLCITDITSRVRHHLHSQLVPNHHGNIWFPLQETDRQSLKDYQSLHYRSQHHTLQLPSFSSSLALRYSFHSHKKCGRRDILEAHQFMKQF